MVGELQMNKFKFFMIALVLTYFTSVTTVTVLAESYFTNSKELNAIFKKMEQEFSTYEKDEVIPQEYYELIETEEDRKNVKPSPKKKITEQQMKEARDRVLNDFRVDIEIKEEELGGLTKADYNLLVQKFEQMLLLSKNSSYGWDTKGKKVSLYVDNAYSTNDAWQFYYDLKGKFSEQGKEKDDPGQYNFNVKEKISKYLNQSKSRGNKINAEVFSKLPAAVEALFHEKEMTPILAGRTLAQIHTELYISEDYNYMGDQSLEYMLEEIDSTIDYFQGNRAEEKMYEYYEYPKDVPSEEFRDTITKIILNEDLTDTFFYGFRNGITLEQLAKLYFGQEDLNEKIVIEDHIIQADSPDYIKNAFIYGLIDNESDLNKSLTRVEAARVLVKGAVYELGSTTNGLPITDLTKISFADQTYVSTCISNGMMTRIDKFEPTGKYTKEEAIIDRDLFDFDHLRGYNIPLNLSDPSKIILGKSTIHLIFKSNAEIKEYMEDNFDYTVLSKIKLTGKYTKINTGGVLIELYTPQKGIKFTIKNGAKFIDFEEGKYGPELQYKLEPKVLKSGEKVNMNLQPDTLYTTLNKKLDAIIKKIIKPSMTDEQKVKAIHDFVVKHITYDGKLQDEHTIESIIKTIDVGRGVCGDYSLLFLHLCRRASIPCVFEAGNEFTINHAWNSVYINGKWLFVDTTWDDDDSGKILYKYYLKDKYTFMKTHPPLMGVPNKDVFKNIDKMKIKNQEELRGYLLQNIYWVDGYKLTFRMADRKIKPNIPYMRDPGVTISLNYDAKKDLYTLSVKKRK